MRIYIRGEFAKHWNKSMENDQNEKTKLNIWINRVFDFARRISRNILFISQVSRICKPAAKLRDKAAP